MMQQNSLRTFSRFQILSGLLCLLVFAAPAFCQDRSADQGGIRGNRAEVAITIKEGSSQLIGPLVTRSEEHTSELQSRLHLVCRLLLEKNTSARHVSVARSRAVDSMSCCRPASAPPISMAMLAAIGPALG